MEVLAEKHAVPARIDMTDVIDLDVSTIHIADVGNDRTQFAVSELEELAESIRSVGQLAPLVVRKRARGGFELVAGERRLRAVRDVLGRDTVRATVADLDDGAAWDAMLDENLYRSDLDPVDEARAMRRRGDELGWSVSQIAKRWKKSANYVTDRLALLELDPGLQDLVRRGQLRIGHAVSLVQLDHAGQREAVRRGASEMTGDEVRRLVSGMVAIRDQTSMFDGAELQQQVYNTRLSAYVDAMATRRASGAADDLVGPTEIAERLGVKKITVYKWQERHADFPTPRAIIGDKRTPIWQWADVQSWAIATGRAAES